MAYEQHSSGAKSEEGCGGVAALRGLGLCVIAWAVLFRNDCGPSRISKAIESSPPWLLFPAICAAPVVFWSWIERMINNCSEVGFKRRELNHNISQQFEVAEQFPAIANKAVLEFAEKDIEVRVEERAAERHALMEELEQANARAEELKTKSWEAQFLSQPVKLSGNSEFYSKLYTDPHYHYNLWALANAWSQKAPSGPAGSSGPRFSIGPNGRC